jgi:hypothetical protein
MYLLKKWCSTWAHVHGYPKGICGGCECADEVLVRLALRKMDQDMQTFTLWVWVIGRMGAGWVIGRMGDRTLWVWMWVWVIGCMSLSVNA